MNIQFGLLAKKPSAQLKGIPIPEKQMRIFDKLAQSAAWCYAHSLVSDSQYDAMLKRLLKLINKEVDKLKVGKETK